MWTTGRPLWIPILTLLFSSNPSATLPADKPPATPTPLVPGTSDATRLSDFASRTALDRSTVAPPGEPLIITSELVRQLASDGLLTVGFPRNRLWSPAARPSPRARTPNPQRIEEEWRAKVLRQKDQVARIQGDILLLDAQIEAIKASAAHGRDGSARRQAKVLEALGRRAVLTRQLERERARLGALIRHAREQGAQPGWFR